MRRPPVSGQAAGRRLALAVLRSAWEENSENIVSILDSAVATRSKPLRAELALSLFDLLCRLCGKRGPVRVGWGESDREGADRAEGTAPDPDQGEAGEMDPGEVKRGVRSKEDDRRPPPSVFRPSGGAAGTDVEAERAEGPARRRRKQRGRPSDTDPKFDKRISDAWQTGRFKTQSDLARAFKLPVRDARLAIQRHRKRLERTRQ